MSSRSSPRLRTKSGKVVRFRYRLVMNSLATQVGQTAVDATRGEHLELRVACAEPSLGAAGSAGTG
jgi:hypothetical protein